MKCELTVITDHYNTVDQNHKCQPESGSDVCRFHTTPSHPTIQLAVTVHGNITLSPLSCSRVPTKKFNRHHILITSSSHIQQCRPRLTYSTHGVSSPQSMANMRTYQKCLLSADFSPDSLLFSGGQAQMCSQHTPLANSMVSYPHARS